MSDHLVSKSNTWMKDSPVKAGLLGGVKKKKNVSAAHRGLDFGKVAEGDTLVSG